MDASVAAIQAAFNNDVEGLRTLAGQYNNQVVLRAAVQGNAVDVLRLILSQGAAADLTMVGLCINTGNATILQLLLAHDPDLLHEVSSDYACGWLTIAATQNYIEILRLLVPRLSRFRYACPLAAGVAARIGHREAAIVIQAHTDITVGVIMHYPDLALEMVRERPDQLPVLLALINLPKPRLLVSVLNEHKIQALDPLQVHNQFNNDAGFWALQSLRPDCSTIMPGLHDHGIRLGPLLRVALGTNLATYLMGRI